ncbi:hypothetical protein CDL15_Pgr000229 [Punica granatum]|uniref:Uncharacterized protein n=1 Tax=Punica granatum TaxID=22663 RepID=A0A218Y1V9_PUNGR|nr:hypothetical protein CDL15_Pgr000229 [Punica granatum]
MLLKDNQRAPVTPSVVGRQPVVRQTGPSKTLQMRSGPMIWHVLVCESCRDFQHGEGSVSYRDVESRVHVKQCINNFNAGACGLDGGDCHGFDTSVWQL